MQSFLKYTLFLMLFVSTSLMSQTLTIYDNDTKKPVDNVFVYNDGQSKVALSDVDGNVNLSAFEEDEEVMIEHVSYQFVFFKKHVLKRKGYTVYLTRTNDLLPEVVLSVANTETDLNRVAEKISVISSNVIEVINPQTTPDLLSRTPGITVQKSQMGGGSPTIRGFEANRVLLVVDGVRMNNAIYRSGHLQNSLTVDYGNLERAEIIYGPASVKYGSDALGGVVHFYTKRPKLGEEFWELNANTSFSTANNGLVLHGDAIYSNEKFGNFSSISYGNFNDLRMGSVRTHGFNNWGKVHIYSNNTEHHYSELPVVNSDPNIQKNTAYSQLDVLQKLIFKLDKSNELEFNFQYSTSSNVPRFDALTDPGDEGLKWAEWYYGPQDRLMFSTRLNSTSDSKWMKKSNITFAYQNIEESRMQRKFGSLEKTFRYEDVNVFSLNADFSTNINYFDISYGAELTYNSVSSVAKGKTLVVSGNDIIGFGDSFVVQSRYPDGGSDYGSFAVYSDFRKIFNEKTTFNLGLRWTSTLMHAKWEDDTFIELPENDISLFNNALTGSIGMTHKPNQNWALKAHVSTAFRSPNIDDVGKVREKNDLLTLPNTFLRPEYALNAEFNVDRYLLNKKLILSADLYYTRIFDYIMRQYYETSDGVNSMVYDGNMAVTIANVNSGQAYVYGANLGMIAKLQSKFTLESFLTYTKGRTIDDDLPMPSIAPLFGSTTLKYNLKKWMFSLNSTYNGRKKAEDFDVYGGVDNLEKAASMTYGTPSWYTINANIRYKFSPNLNLQMGVENILDHHYMTFASGLSAPGRNFVITLRGSI
ncbi:MAG: TonB-dependent receptor [Bacteroidota bacterium]